MSLEHRGHRVGKPVDRAEHRRGVIRSRVCRVAQSSHCNLSHYCLPRLVAREPSNPRNTGNRDYDWSVKLTLKAVQWAWRRIASIASSAYGPRLTTHLSKIISIGSVQRLI